MSLHLRKKAVLFAALLAASPLAAQDEKPTGDSVVATVNGVDITVGHMVIARNGLPDQYRELPDELLFKALLDQLINQTILEQSFDGDEPTRVRKSLDNERRTLVAAEAIELVVAEKLTDAALQVAYDDKYAKAAAEKEFNAAHILVETEDEAKALIAELENGADFTALAKEKSTGPSGPNGGSLGWFGKGMMVAPFEAAVAEMEDGGVSAPVQTQFGWHVIKLVESRVAEAPTFDDVKASLEQELSTKIVEEELARLTKLGKVERSAADAFDPAILKDQSLVGE